MTTELDDHLPPPTQRKAARRQGANEASAPVEPGRVVVWGDRVLFLAVGLVLGFASAYLYLDKGSQPQMSASADPHAGMPGMGNPGATRDMPDGSAGAGANPVSADPTLRQKLNDLEQAVAKSPESYDLLVALGNAAYDANDPRRAVDAYERALKIKDGDVNVQTDLGVSYRNLGNTDKALELFERALKADPKHWPALYNEIIVYGVDRGDVKKAQTLLARLREQNPQAPALESLAKTLEEKAAGK